MRPYCTCIFPMDPHWSLTPPASQHLRQQTVPQQFSELVQSKEHFKSFFHITFHCSVTQVKRYHLSVWFLCKLICILVIKLILFRHLYQSISDSSSSKYSNLQSERQCQTWVNLRSVQKPTKLGRGRKNKASKHVLYELTGHNTIV